MKKRLTALHSRPKPEVVPSIMYRGIWRAHTGKIMMQSSNNIEVIKSVMAQTGWLFFRHINGSRNHWFLLNQKNTDPLYTWVLRDSDRAEARYWFETSWQATEFKNQFDFVDDPGQFPASDMIEIDINGYTFYSHSSSSRVWYHRSSRLYTGPYHWVVIDSTYRHCYFAFRQDAINFSIADPAHSPPQQLGVPSYGPTTSL